MLYVHANIRMGGWAMRACLRKKEKRKNKEIEGKETRQTDVKDGSMEKSN